MKLGANEVSIPESAYCDLANVDAMSTRLIRGESSMYMWMRGGDGAGAYRAKIEIVDLTVRRRLISHYKPNGDFAEEEVLLATDCGVGSEP
ncbi:MAG: hypothetical protein ACQGVC_04250 [Myxococcota bacterium]